MDEKQCQTGPETISIIAHPSHSLFVTLSLFRLALRSLWAPFSLAKDKLQKNFGHWAKQMPF